MTVPVSYVFAYESRVRQFAEIRIDCTVEILFSQNYADFCCGAIDGIEVHEITNMDTGEDLTRLKDQPQLLAEITEQIEKAESYLLDRAG